MKIARLQKQRPFVKIRYDPDFDTFADLVKKTKDQVSMNFLISLLQSVIHLLSKQFQILSIRSEEKKDVFIVPECAVMIL